MTQPSFEFATADSFAAMGSAFRQQLLADMREPVSAVTLAKRHDMSRQRIGYHMRDLEKAGCIALVEERAQRGLTEKLYQVTPRVYTQAPADLGPDQTQSAFSFTKLVNVLASGLFTLGRIANLVKPNQRVATLALQAQLHFENPQQRKAFTEDLLDAVEHVLRKHEQPQSESTRTFNLVLGAYPDVAPDATAEQQE